MQYNVLTDIHHEMVATISLVNIHHLIYIYIYKIKEKEKKVSCEENSGFTLSYVTYSSVIIILYITSSTYLSYTWKCVPFDHLHPVLPAPYSLASFHNFLKLLIMNLT